MTNMNKNKDFVFEISGIKATKLSKMEIITALRKFSKIKSHQPFKKQEFDAWGNRPISTASIEMTFGSWLKAMKAADLRPTKVYKYDPDEMVETFRNCWISNKGEPTWKQLEDFLNKTFSPYKVSSYIHYFGGLRRLAQRIVAHQKGEITNKELYERGTTRKKRIPISHKKRYEVLKRDGERCVKCGASPKINSHITLEIDHIIPVSKGGDNSLNNLQTLCSPCNQGKKDREN